MKPGDDIEKVYFDGKSVYIPGATSAIAMVKGAPVELKGDAPAAAASDAPKVECDEFDLSCDDDIAAYKKDKVDVSGDLNRSNAQADARDYSASAAAQDVKDRFGIADEVRFWSAVALSALAAGSAVIGVLQQMKSSEANDAYKQLEAVANAVEPKIGNVCSDPRVTDKDYCTKMYKETNEAVFTVTNWTYSDLQRRMKIDKDTKESYATARNLWFGVTAVSLTTAIILFAW